MENSTLAMKQRVKLEPTPLSHSPLWQSQREYFIQHGVEAWRQNIVPSYITSNPFIAHAYTQVVFGYLDDILQQTPNGNLDQTFYILELGAGSGRFAFHFLKQFWQEYPERYEHLPVQPQVRYVMADIVTANLQFWQEHEQLIPFVEQGLLDFALFDACRDTSLQLLVSGETLSAETPPNGIAVIGNYLFDCIPNDLFEVKDGKLYECLVSLTDDEETVTEQLLNLEDVEVQYHLQTCRKDYYERDIWNEVLKLYPAALNQGAFLFPTGALQCLENLQTLSQGRFMFLSGDKGQSRIEAFEGRRKPSLMKHGKFCFSLSVNYHALSTYGEKMGATVLKVPHVHSSLNIMGFLWGGQSQGFRQTKRAYQKHIVEFGPDDFFAIKKGAEKNYDDLSLQQIIGLLRLSRWDTAIFLGCYERLINLLAHATDVEKQDFHQCIQIIWQQYFILNKKHNPAFHLGTLMAAIGDYQESINYYQLSQKLGGNTAHTEFNLGLSYWNLGKIANSQDCMKQALNLEPNFQPATDFLEEINTFLNRCDAVLSQVPNLANEETKIKQLDKHSLILEGIRNPNISLEPLKPTHAEAMYKYGTPEILNLARLPTFSGHKDALNWVYAVTADYSKYPFAITHKKFGFIGIISVKKNINNSGYFFLWLEKDYWGKGYGTTAICKLLQLVFDVLDLDELLTCVFTHNQRSIHIMEKLGFDCLNTSNNLHLYRCGLSQLSDYQVSEKLQYFLTMDNPAWLVH